MRDIFKGIVKHHIAIILILIGYIGYFVLMSKESALYQEYNGMSGTVLSVSKAEATGRQFAVIQLENGLVGKINNGHQPIKKGDTWVNDLNWTPFMGITGTAYSIIPNETRTLILKIPFLLVFSLTSVVLTIFIIVAGYTAWNKFVQDKLFRGLFKDEEKEELHVY